MLTIARQLPQTQAVRRDRGNRSVTAEIADSSNTCSSRTVRLEAAVSGRKYPETDPVRDHVRAAPRERGTESVAFGAAAADREHPQAVLPASALCARSPEHALHPREARWVVRWPRPTAAASSPETLAARKASVFGGGSGRGRLPPDARLPSNDRPLEPAVPAGTEKV
jgi:hypothetical protein